MCKRMKRLFRKIGEINNRYRQPRIEMSSGVVASLLFLRIYLLFLVCLMVYKFILLVQECSERKAMVAVLEHEFFLSEILGRRVYLKTEQIGRLDDW